MEEGYDGEAWVGGRGSGRGKVLVESKCFGCEEVDLGGKIRRRGSYREALGRWNGRRKKSLAAGPSHRDRREKEGRPTGRVRKSEKRKGGKGSDR